MGSTSAALTIVQLRKLFAQFGLPTTLVSDNGLQFTAQEFEDFCSSNGIKHIWVTPYHPSSISLAERAVRVVKEGLKKQNTSDTLTDRLSRVLISYRITPQSTTRIAPAELLFGRNLTSKLDLLKPSADKKRLDIVTKQQVQKQNHDKHSKGREFQIGDHVYVKNRSSGDRWLAGTVTTVSGPVSYNVRLSDGRIWRCHQDQLRKDYIHTAESGCIYWWLTTCSSWH